MIAKRRSGSERLKRNANPWVEWNRKTERCLSQPIREGSAERVRSLGRQTVPTATQAPRLFLELLRSLRPKPALLAIWKDVVFDVWKHDLTSVRDTRQRIGHQANQDSSIPTTVTERNDAARRSRSWTSTVRTTPPPWSTAAATAWASVSNSEPALGRSQHGTDQPGEGSIGRLQLALRQAERLVKAFFEKRPLDPRLLS